MRNNSIGLTKNAGFSLIELLVSIVISGLVLSTVMAGYWTLVQAHHTTEIKRNMTQETTFALTRIADRVRTYSVDYEAYNSLPSPGTCATVSFSGSEILCLGQNNVFEKTGTQLLMNTQPLISPQFEVTMLNFQISPGQDPFQNISNKTAQLQPKVTILLETRSVKDPSLSFLLQTTISSRKYSAQ